MGVRIWDRLLHREGPLPSGPHQFGRFIMLDGPRSLSMGGRRLSAGDYLAADGAWTLWDDTANRSSSGRLNPRALPEEITIECLLALGGRLDPLNAGSASAHRWLNENPLMQRKEIESQIKRRRLDDRIDDHLDALKDVCHRPADRLQVVNRMVPVGAARRIVPATITRLAAHSEDWNRIVPDGIEPNLVLTPTREENFDFYENRVAARLVEHLWQDIDRRLGEINRIDAMTGDIRRYTREASQRGWRSHDKLFDLIRDIADDRPWQDLVTRRQKELRECRDALFSLRGAGVLPGVNRHAEIGTALRATNLFINEDRYRRVRDLWQAWVDDRTGTSGADQTARISKLCRGFADYSALLVLHALEHLGHLDEPGLETRPFARGAPPLRLSGTPVTLAWLDADVFEFAAEGEPILRIIPLAHAVTGAGREAAIRDEIMGLTATEPAVPALLIYPGQASERGPLPTRLRLMAFAGCDARSPDGRGWSLLPVSPLELDSVMRLARSLRSVLERHRHRGYPVLLVCQSAHARTLAEGAKWVSVRPDGLALTRAPSPRELAALRARLTGMAKRAAGRIDLRGEVEPLNRLAADLPTAVARIAEFATCPVCGLRRRDPWHTLRPRPRDDTYECTCDPTHGGRCRTRWELRVCASCRHPYPVLQPEPALRPATFDGDELDRRFGSHLVTAPCWLRPSVFVCPLCGVCGEALAGRASACQRCSPSPGTSDDAVSS